MENYTNIIMTRSKLSGAIVFKMAMRFRGDKATIWIPTETEITNNI